MPAMPKSAQAKAQRALINLRQRLEFESKMWRTGTGADAGEWYALAQGLASISTDINTMVEYAIREGNRRRADLDSDD